jgi:sulfur carrier protein ThiS
MRIIIERPARTISRSFHGTLRELLKREHINHESVLVVRAGALITLDDVVSDADELRLLSVISGG